VRAAKQRTSVEVLGGAASLNPPDSPGLFWRSLPRSRTGTSGFSLAPGSPMMGIPFDSCGSRVFPSHACRAVHRHPCRLLRWAVPPIFRSAASTETPVGRYPPDAIMVRKTFFPEVVLPQNAGFFTG